MKTKMQFLSVMLVLAVSVGSAAAATVPIGFDFDGLSGAGTVAEIGTWDYLPSSALAVFSAPLPLEAGEVFTLYTHGVVGSFLDGNSQIISVPTGFEVTVVSGFREVVSYLSPDGANASFALANGLPNFFEMYIDFTPDADSDLVGGTAGSGFSDGILLLSGDVTFSGGSFGVFGQTPVPLDSFGTDEASGAAGFNASQLSLSGAGGSSVTIGVGPTFINRDFFYDVPDNFSLNLFFNTSQVLPFNQVDPSNIFYNGTLEQALAMYGTMGSVNGFTQDGTLFMFQVDGNQSQNVVPEPGTMLLLGSGLLGLALIGRKKMMK